MAIPNYFALSDVKFDKRSLIPHWLIQPALQVRMSILDEELDFLQFVETGVVPALVNGGAEAIRSKFTEAMSDALQRDGYAHPLQVACIIQCELFHMQFRRSAYFARVHDVLSCPEAQAVQHASVPNVREICADLITAAEGTTRAGIRCNQSSGTGGGDSFAVGVNIAAAASNPTEEFLLQQLQTANLLIDELKSRLEARQ